ncbi:DUF6612 family protein [Metabacillus sp. SLBN-84]
MKKWSLLIGLLFTLVLAGCGQSAATNEEKEDKQAEKAEAETTETADKEKEATAEEVLASASEKSADLKNFAMDGTMDMIVTSSEGKMETTADMQTKTNIEPLVMQQTMNMSAEGQTTSIEMYMDDQYIYMNDPVSGGWIKMSQAGPGMGEMMNQAKTMTPADQIKQMEAMADDIQLEETDTEYILSVKGNGEKLMSLTGNMMGSDPNMQAVMDQMDIEQIDYTYTLDKETYYPKALDMVIKMFVTENNEEVELQQSISTKFSEMNELEGFSIPKEVLDQAVEVQPGG